MVRVATEQDLEHCAALGLKFIKAACMPEATYENCLDTCIRLWAAPEAVLFVTDQGVMAGIETPLYYRPDYRQAFELFWWSEDKRGLDLLRAFEKWAVARGIDEINMSTLQKFSKDGIGRLLERRGYVARDMVFTRRLK